MKEWNILLRYHENMNNNENIEFVFLIYPLSLYYSKYTKYYKKKKNRG